MGLHTFENIVGDCPRFDNIGPLVQHNDLSTDTQSGYGIDYLGYPDDRYMGGLAK